jgi:methyltransferase (TIGR00027 family)
MSSTMQDDTPSRTAAWVAVMRALGGYLPEPLRLAADPYGFAFAGPRFERLLKAPAARATAPLWLRGVLRMNVLWLQLRTRIIDDAILRFVDEGGRQILVLGAGYDCRAWRLHPKLRGAAVYEVDHPATQRKKRAELAAHGACEPDAGPRCLAWDFERDPIAELPDRLAALGLDRGAPTLSLLEGVLPYLSQEATHSTFACVRALSAPGSPFVFTYFEQAIIERRRTGIERHVVRLAGEPYRGGFEPDALVGWLEARGFALEYDEAAWQIARRLLPAREARGLLPARRHVAVARSLARSMGSVTSA